MKKERIAHFNQLSAIHRFESRENMIHYFGEEKKKNRESIPGNENEINLTLSLFGAPPPNLGCPGTSPQRTPSSTMQ